MSIFQMMSNYFPFGFYKYDFFQGLKFCSINLSAK